MSTVDFTVTFSTQDILRDPQVRKGLRAREDAYLDNLAWLDEDLNNKMEGRRKDLLQEIEKGMTTALARRAPLPEGYFGHPTPPRVWHCGHGTGGSHAGDADTLGLHAPEKKKARRKRIRKQYEDGLVDGTCLIGHRLQQENEKGNNTRKQFTKFKSEAKEGDIIFNHCSRLGGLTHYGIYTGKISQRPSPAPEDVGQGWLHSFISVDLWIPLPEVVKGTGKNFTLYEVTPTNKDGTATKNYQNYSIPS